MTNQPIRIGVLGTAKIAPGALIEPAAQFPQVTVQAVAARSAERAATFAAQHGIAHVDQDYAALIARDDVDLIYNPLPPSEHAHWTIEALRAGKHVLCEKPFAMDAVEAEAMVSEARKQGLHLIEAYHYRFHDQHARIRELLPEIGRIKTLDAEFSVAIPYAPGEFRYVRELGGGALMDLGCYPLHLARSTLDGEPVVEHAEADLLDGGVDESMHMRLKFPGGTVANLHCTMKLNRQHKIIAHYVGEKGTLTVRNYVTPQEGKRLRLRTDARNLDEDVLSASTYTRQLKHVIGVLAGKAQPITGGQDAIDQMRAIDAAYALVRD